MMLKIRWKLQAWLSGAWTAPFQALTENGLVSVATGVGTEPHSDVSASPSPQGDGGGGREASGWRGLFQIVLVPEQSVIQYALGGGVRGVGATQRCQLVPAANDKSPPLGWETQNYTSDS